jgi:hypothetical protein
MCKISIRSWIANAAARFRGARGSVTKQAQAVDCSRQTVYDHASQVEAAVEARHSNAAAEDDKDREIAALGRENAQLWDELDQTIELPLAKQQMFTAQCVAMGLSCSQTHDLLAFLLGDMACPGRSTIHRWVQAAGRAAGTILKRLDRDCKAWVLVGCLDEIFFHRKAVLVGVEPKSMVWFLGKIAADRRGPTWFGELRPWTALGYVTCDAGTGLQAGIALMQKHQRDTGGIALQKGLDVFPTQREAHRALGRLWNRVERAWEKAEQAERKLHQAQRQGRSLCGLTHPVKKAWEKVKQEFPRYEKREAVWKQVEPALEIFRPDGRLNDRAWAQKQVAWALTRLPGPEWAKVRRLLQEAESFSFLDRLHDQLGQVPVPEPAREALVRLWWLRRQWPRKARGTDPASCEQIFYLLQLVLCQQLDPNWLSWYRQVARVLAEAVRASSAVECMNSVLRMHQARHRTVTPEMLDLKRLYWNLRQFGGGKRKGHCPYKLLGLKLPSYDFCALLEAEMPVAIAQAKAVAKAKRAAIAA